MGPETRGLRGTAEAAYSLIAEISSNDLVRFLTKLPSAAGGQDGNRLQAALPDSERPDVT